MKVLAVNAGSSSLKYQLIDFDNKKVLAQGLCERIGVDGRLVHRAGNKGEKQSFDICMPTHHEAISAALDILIDQKYAVIKSLNEIDAVGHRVAHGGDEFKSSVRVDADVLKKLEDLAKFAPLHNGPEAACIRACIDLMGKNTPQVAVFDTSFHQSMPQSSFMYALPYEYYTKDKVRRYGFHGTSHRYVSARAADIMEQPIENLKLVSCHLGNGSSITAVDGGRSVDTSMGFTPGAGLPMGTRAGDIDTGIISYLMDEYHLDIHAVDDILQKKSGMLGLSGVSSDFRDIEAEAAQGNSRAQLAIDVFCHWVRKHIGAYAAVMGGIDGIIFTAGVGENDAIVRREACRTLGYLGVELDGELNDKVHGCECLISKPQSRVKVLVVPTNEELMIAADTVALTSV